MSHPETIDGLPTIRTNLPVGSVTAVISSCGRPFARIPQSASQAIRALIFSHIRWRYANLFSRIPVKDTCPSPQMRSTSTMTQLQRWA